MNIVKSLLRPAGLALLAFCSLPAQTVTQITIGKTEYYRQTHDVPLNPGSTVDLDTSNPYGSAGFHVTVKGTGLSASTVTLAAGSTYGTANPTEHNAGVLVLNGDGDWGYGLSSGRGIAAPTPLQNGSTNVHSYFSNGSYTVSVPTVGSVSLSLGGAGVANPGLAGVTFSQGTWSGGKFVFDPTLALTITTATYPQYFTGGTSIGGIMSLGVESGQGFGGFEDVHFSRVAGAGFDTDEDLLLTDNFMTHTFAANTFTAGQDYEGFATFGRIMSQDLSISGSSSFAYFERENSFTLSAAAIPEPSTYAMLAGAAALALAVLRRRRQAAA